MAYRFAGMGACETIRSLKMCCDSCAAGGSCGRGLSGCGCGGSCDKDGMGIFETGLDFTSWGIPEWSVVGIGLYTLFSLLGDSRRGVARVRRVSKAARAAAR